MTSQKPPKTKPPRLVKGERPHIVFYAPEVGTGDLKRVRVYAPADEATGHKLSRWRNRTIAVINDLLERRFRYSKEIPRKKHAIRLQSRDGKPYTPPSPKRSNPVPAGLVQALTWANERRANQVSSKTTGTYQSAITKWAKWEKEVGSFRVENTTPADVAEFSDWVLADPNVGPRTRNNILANLRALFTRVVKAEAASKNPFTGFGAIKSAKRQINEAFTEEQARSTLAHLKENDPAVYFFSRMIYWTFARPVEIARLQVKNIDREKGIFFLTAATTKGKKSRAVQLPDEAAQMLREYLPADTPKEYYLVSPSGRPRKNQVGRDTLSKRHLDALREIGLDGLGMNLYSWKHTGVCAAFDAGMALRDISHRCGHASLSQTEEYLRDLRRIVPYSGPASW